MARSTAGSLAAARLEIGEYEVPTHRQTGTCSHVNAVLTSSADGAPGGVPEQSSSARPVALLLPHARRDVPSGARVPIDARARDLFATAGGTPPAGLSAYRQWR